MDLISTPPQLSKLFMICGHINHRNFQSWTKRAPRILLKYFLCLLYFILLLPYKDFSINSEEKFNLPIILLYQVICNLALSLVKENRQINMANSC